LRIPPFEASIEVTARGPHILVVGGTRGIGRAVARRLADDDQAVSVIGRSRPARDPDQPRIKSWSADVADLSALRSTLDEIVGTQGPLSGAVLLQRYRGGGNDWTGEIATSLTATRELMEWAGDHFEDLGRGKAVILISSIASASVASEQPVSYHAAKAAMSHMVRYYAVSLGRKGIRVNAICPGTIVKEESKAFYAQHPEIERLYREIVPLGRMGTSEDVAELAAFLVSDRAGFLTGQNIVLDGGVSLQSVESMGRHLAGIREC
jgi:NAD(P)-dependent dehydrogenase (short-subunit alcohol dehydrogenase family)